MTWKLLLKNKKIRIVLSQTFSKDFRIYSCRFQMTLLKTEMLRNLLNVSLMNLISLFDMHFFFCGFFMKLFTDLLQHRFSFPIPLQFFLSFEHFYVVITLSCAIKIEGLGFLIICMRRFNVLLQMLSTGMACTSII